MCGFQFVFQTLFDLANQNFLFALNFVLCIIQGTAFAGLLNLVNMPVVRADRNYFLLSGMFSSEESW